MQGVIQSAIAWLCSSNLRRETLLAPQGLAVPQQRGWCHTGGQATLGGAAVGDLGSSAAPDLRLSLDQGPTRMPLPLLLLQQLQCRDSGFGSILKIDLQGNPPKAQNRQIR
jgi:hypothetical protein